MIKVPNVDSNVGKVPHFSSSDATGSQFLRRRVKLVILHDFVLSEKKETKTN